MARDPADCALRRLNLELLIIFKEVMETGQAKIAADNLAVTQSAISHGLRRLSHLLDTQLFIRDRWLLTPTPRASEISPAVNTIIAAALTLVSPATSKDAGQSKAE